MKICAWRCEGKMGQIFVVEASSSWSFTDVDERRNIQSGQLQDISRGDRKDKRSTSAI
jgi:hypothetical protein